MSSGTGGDLQQKYFQINTKKNESLSQTQISNPYSFATWGRGCTMYIFDNSILIDLIEFIGWNI